MRTLAELRDRWRARLAGICRRPDMWATRAPDTQTALELLLSDLCFLDDRDHEYETVRERLHRYGEYGVVGPFRTVFGADGDYRAEVASVLAEQAHRLGYLPVDRLLDPAAQQRLTATVPDRFTARDVRRSAVEAAYGPPSLVVGGRVLCYAPAAGGDWVFVDCFFEPHRRYVPDAGEYRAEPDPDPLVRAVRLPAADVTSGLVLTLYGRVLRWGPGWWVHHPDG